MSATVKEMMRLIFGSTRSHLIHCAVKLDIVHHVSKHPMNAEQLSALTKTKPDLLYRFLRSLCSIGILERNVNGTFSVTELGLTLKSGTENCLKNYLLVVQDETLQQSLMNLDHTLQTGEPSFEHLFGMTHFEYLGKHTRKGSVFDNAMKEFENIRSIVPTYDYTAFNHIVDIGGGNGHFLIAILERTPNAKGTLFDLEASVNNAKVEIEMRNMGSRCTTTVGNFFESVPNGADCYILRQILHTLDDNKVLKVLSNVRKEMKKSSKLLIMEQVIFDCIGPDPKTEFDMVMLVLNGGKSRTKHEIEELCAKVMLKLQNCVELKECGEIIMEFAPV